MPVATPFTALPALPFCVTKRDVSDVDFWITLGGTQKGQAATTETIGQSLINATKLFWNTYGASANLDGTSYTIDVDNDATFGSSEPKDRICPDGANRFGFALEDLASGLAVFQCEASSQNIIRMYNGSTSNEANFVGYGVDTYITAESDVTEGDLIIQASSVDVQDGAASYAYTTLQSIPFLGIALSGAFPGDTTTNPANFTATYNVNPNTLSISSFELYTYA